ncbi:MAG: 4Fe-4S binding protein [Brevinematia bacterium]
MERLVKGKLVSTFIEVDPERCKGCLLCVYECPEGVIDSSGKFNSKGWIYVEATLNERCTGCKRCAIVCPDLAIRVYIKEESVVGSSA